MTPEQAAPERRHHVQAINRMERHGKVRKPPACVVTTEGDAASDDNGKKSRRRRFPFRYSFVHYQHLQRIPTQQLTRLLLLVAGAMSIFHVAHNANVIFHHKTHPSSKVRSPIRSPRVLGEQIILDAGYLLRPLAVGYYFRDSDSHSWTATERLDYLVQPHFSHTTISVSERARRAQMRLLDSNEYEHRMRDEFEDGDCKAQYQWQLESYPTCNLLHEQELGLLVKDEVQLLGHGYWRDVWKVIDGDQEVYVLKTLRYEHDFEDRNYDRHRRDALAMLRMTASPNVINIYSYCGNSGMFEYAPGGDMEEMIWYSDDKWNSTERLIVAYQVATAIADLHTVEEDGRPSIAHTDITTSQFVYVDGRYKLNDFNRCRFIAWNQKTNKQCGFYVGSNPGHVSMRNINTV